MRVLYFHQYFNTPRAAGGIRSYKMARCLVERGHEVTMVCGARDILSGPFQNGKRQGIVDGIEVIELELSYSNYYSLSQRALVFLRFAWRSIQLALTRDYDLIFATSTPLTAGIPGIFARHLRRKPFVFEVRDLWPELPRALGLTNPLALTGMNWLEWLSYHSAQGCVGLSPGIVEGIKRRGIDADKVTMIPNGCDLELFGDENTQAWRPEGIAEGDFVAAFTGAHGVANGLAAVLDAAAELKRRGRADIKLLFVGDGKLKPELMERAAQEGLGNCQFLDKMPRQDISRLMKDVDVGLMILANIPAFYYGTSPNKFFDYIAAGLPVLNNYPGWLADMIQEHRCGLVVPPENAESFADALEYLADHRDELPEMGRNARRLAEHRFDREDHADALVDFLETVVRTAPQQPRAWFARRGQ